LNSRSEELSMEISIGKTKIMTFIRNEPIRSKICINRRLLEQGKTFNYLGCNICYEGEKDLKAKIINFVR
jgi:hypothetical protein